MLKNEVSETLLLDLSDAAVKELIRNAKKRGYVTHDQINALLSSEEVKSEQIEDILGKLSEMGINVVESKEAELGRDVATRDVPVVGAHAQLTVAIAAPSDPGRPPRLQAPAIARVFAPPLKPADECTGGREMATDGITSESNPDDDDIENWLSVAAIEAELKPKVIETFDTIAEAYKRLRRLQDQDIQFQLRRRSLSPAQERKYKKLKNEIIGEVKPLRLNR